MTKRLLVLALVLSLPCSCAFAATVTFTLVPNGGAGTFELYADVSQGDNFGLVTYGVPLTGPITSLTHMTPASNALSPNFQPGGFTTLRSANNNPTVTGSQQLVPTPTLNLIGGFGQVANSFAALGLTDVTALSPVVAWDASLLLAVGTYDSGAGELGINTQAGDFAAAIFVDDGLTQSRAADEVIGLVVPEPGTIALAGLALVGLIGRRRLA